MIPSFAVLSVLTIIQIPRKWLRHKPTPFGSKERAYFCDRALDEKERKDLVMLKYHTVHFSHIPKEWYQEMCGRLPIPFPAEVEKKYVR